MAHQAAVADGEDRSELDGPSHGDAVTYEVHAPEHAVQLPVRQPPFDRSTSHAGAVQLSSRDQPQLALRDPRDDQVAREATMYKARNHPQPDHFRDISIREMLMSRRRESAGRSRAFYMGIRGHRITWGSADIALHGDRGPSHYMGIGGRRQPGCASQTPVARNGPD